MAIEEFMVTMPFDHEPGQKMEARAPDGQVLKFAAPAVKAGSQFPVAYTPGRRGGSPPVDTDLLMVMHGVMSKYEVSLKKASDLLVLKDYDIILLVDDSGSMRRIDSGSRRSRWEELRATLELVVSIGGCFDKDGLDIYFLNAAKISGVRTIHDDSFVQAMRRQPSGGTPLTRLLSEIVRDRERASVLDYSLRGKPVLLMIFTDGTPDGGSMLFGNALRGVLRQETTDLRFRCQIMACTGNDADVAWLNALDEQLPELDVTDDYLTEKSQIGESFTRGDWCMKAMLGAVNSAYGDLDENRKRKRRKTTALSSMEAPPLQRKKHPCLQWALLLACIVGIVYVIHTLTHIKD